MLEGRARDRGRLRRAIAVTWKEFGWLGRVGLLGIFLAAVMTMILGFWIPATAKRHLLLAQSDTFSALATSLAERGLVPVDPGDPTAIEALDDEVRFRLLGGETVRVKLWTAEGVIAYSDAADLIGRRFELTPPAARALGGEASFTISDLSDPAHELDRDLGELIEHYIPVVDPSGTVVGAFEVEQRTDNLTSHLGHIRRNVWLSIGIGMGVVAVFVGSYVVAGARANTRRRRQAERLLAEMTHARESERRRIVGALHGDVGQPLYRLLYGLEGSRGKVGDPAAVDAELGRMADLVRDIDATLRAELSHLHHAAAEDVGLPSALEQLVADTMEETDLDVSLKIDLEGSLPPEASSALFWAAEEGVINARKHSGASRVAVSVSSENGLAMLRVTDDGSGVRGPEGLGLVTIRERLERVNGGLAVEPGRRGGTTLSAWVPRGGEH